MKKILEQIINLFCNFIPIPNLRRTTRAKLHLLFKIKYLINNIWLTNIYEKQYWFNKNKNNIDTLIIGSSHGYYGFIPLKNEYNLSFSSQDLYYSYQLYKKYGCLNNLKNVILFYSVFSPGAQVQKTRDKDIAVCYKIICDIPYVFQTDENFKQKEKQAIYILNKYSLKYNKTYRGECEYIYFMNDSASVRASSHLKNNKRNNNQTKYVEKIFQLSKNRNQNLYIVIPPHRKDYIDCLPEFKELFKELFMLQKKEFVILNFYNDLRFNYNDFGDTDHLNRAGALKLTILIRDAIKNNIKL